ncbi:predicted protein [Nematostella vectensis]|uniref:Dehydrogenase/reductase SDR family member 7 n=1 Tax=Nematostella vectensis TaxID=45351 RepID=A7RI27_NEMVE|nr:predicted protein [Nematostella vectensis]|eukprot:XP_001641021.1 predicted protein [Nematostella vectensis]
MANYLRLAILLAFLAVSFPFVKYFIYEYQEAELTLHFYERFGVDPGSVFNGKVVWITGASSGIGEHLAYEFTKHGSKLVLSARREKRLEQVKNNCLERGLPLAAEDILVLPLDLTKFDTHSELAEKAVQHFGRVDVLVNNAGTASLDYIRNTPLRLTKKVLDTNILGTISVTEAVLPHMLKRGKGHIAVVNSIMGKFAFPLIAPYVTSKFGLEGYFKVLRFELLSRNIDVTTLAIGLVGPTEIFAIAEGADGKKYKFPDVSPTQFMSPERCAYWSVVAIANRMDEPCISRHTVLAVSYLNQYMPSLYRW